MDKIEKRDLKFDTLKGIGIILMVLGHTSCPITNFIYLFHMALFFICSGVFFKEKHYKSFNGAKNFILSKIKHLYFPFALWNGFLAIIHNFLIKINIITDNPDISSLNNPLTYTCKIYDGEKVVHKFLEAFIFNHQEILGGASWFLKILFLVSISVLIIHFIEYKLIKNEKWFNFIRLIIFFIALNIGFFIQITNEKAHSSDIVLSCMILYYFGILYQKYREKINIGLFGFILSFISLAICYYFTGGEYSIGENKYPSPIWLIYASISGFIFILSISNFISKNKLLEKIFTYIGQHTISILLFHFLAFKVVTNFQVIKFNYPKYYLAAFPTLHTENGIWVIYSVVGIILPLLASYFYSKILNFIKHPSKEQCP